jgi:hypothetical protein
MAKEWSNRRVVILLVPTLIAMFMLFAISFLAYADVPPDLPMYNMAEGSILKLDRDIWGQTIGHTIRSGEMVEQDYTVYWYKTYELGTAVPKHGTMLHDLSMTVLVLSPGSAETGVIITLRYRRDMGDGLTGTTLLYMTDTDYDMRPDKISRRNVVSKHRRIYSMGPGITNDTYVFESVLPTDMSEWNEWVAWIVKQYKKEGAFVEGGVM